MPTRLTPLWLQLAALVAAAPLYAQQTAVDPQPAAPPAATEAGQRVAVDPQTGRVRGLTPEEARTLVESLIGSLDQSDAGLIPTVLPNGAKALDLQGRFEAVTLAKIAADGKLASECVTTKDAADRFLNDSPTERPAEATQLEEK